jgi:triosephosphate isomerase
MNKIIIANWKMNGSISKVKSDFDIYINNDLNKNAIFLPPILYLHIINQLVSTNEKSINLGCQNISEYSNYGAYTGEISLEMLIEFNIRYALVGHSERRMMGENDDIIFNKLKHCIANKIIPILCIGETKQLRDSNNYLQLIEKQLSGLVNININQPIYIAYEPIWAIGSGIIPNIEQIYEVTTFIQNYLSSIGLNNFKIFYGGSVNVTNASQILNISNIDGLLVGGVSLNPNELLQILALI